MSEAQEEEGEEQQTSSALDFSLDFLNIHIIQTLNYHFRKLILSNLNYSKRITVEDGQSRTFSSTPLT